VLIITPLSQIGQRPADTGASARRHAQRMARTCRTNYGYHDPFVV